MIQLIRNGKVLNSSSGGSSGNTSIPQEYITKIENLENNVDDLKEYTSRKFVNFSINKNRGVFFIYNFENNFDFTNLKSTIDNMDDSIAVDNYISDSCSIRVFVKDYSIPLKTFTITTIESSDSIFNGYVCAGKVSKLKIEYDTKLLKTDIEVKVVIENGMD